MSTTEDAADLTADVTDVATGIGTVVDSGQVAVISAVAEVDATTATAVPTSSSAPSDEDELAEVPCVSHVRAVEGLDTVITNSATGEEEVVGVVLTEETDQHFQEQSQPDLEGDADDVFSAAAAQMLEEQQALVDSEALRAQIEAQEVKTEMEDGQEELYATLSQLAAEISPQALMQIVAGRLFDNFSIWDMILLKARSSVVAAGAHRAIDSVLQDSENVLIELKTLFGTCLEPIPKKELGRGKRRPREGIDVPGVVSEALGLEDGMYKRRDTEKLTYQACIELPTLFGPEGFHVKPEESQEMAQLRASALDDDDDATESNMNRIHPMVDDTDKDPDFRRTSSRKGKGKVTKVTKAKGGRSGQGSKVGATAPLKQRKPKKPTNRLKFSFREESNKFYCTFKGCIMNCEAFKSREEVEEHFNETHVKDENKVVPCYLCEEKFALTSQRNAHMEATHERSYGCAKCDKRFWRERDAEDHVTRSHGDVSSAENFDPSCVCVKCGKRFNSKAYVDQHESRCDGLFVRQPKFTKFNGEYICTEPGCNVGQGFSGEYGLRVHFYDYHLREEEKVYQCDTCGQKFGLRTMLNKHINTAHEKKHVCDYCGKRFGGKDKLLTHTYTHTGEKPFQCDKCDYRTAKKYNLDQHKVSKHQDYGDRNFSCDLCGKQFWSAGRVTNHKKVIHRDGRNIGGRKRGPKMVPVNTSAPVTAEDMQVIQEDIESPVFVAIV